MLFQRGVIFLRSVSRSDHRRSLRHYRARSDGEVKARDRAVQDIGDEDPGVVELVVDGQVPRTVQLRREGGGRREQPDGQRRRPGLPTPGARPEPAVPL